MKNEEITIQDFLCELHVGLERQGPGNYEMTRKALSFLEDLADISKTVDLGCGTGGQTMILARYLNGDITGVDLFPDFINVFNDNAKKLNLGERVNAIVGSMENLSFQKEEFDLIWSEGAIDCIGFEKGITYWNGFLRKNGYIAVTSASWFTNDRPSEIEKWWTDAVPDIATIGQNILSMQKAGYIPVAAFTLPETCWTDNYFTPREAAAKALSKKYAGNKIVEAFVEDDRREVELYSKYKKYYGYVFYIGKKI